MLALLLVGLLSLLFLVRACDATLELEQQLFLLVLVFLILLNALVPLVDLLLFFHPDMDLLFAGDVLLNFLFQSGWRLQPFQLDFITFPTSI